NREVKRGVIISPPPAPRRRYTAWKIHLTPSHPPLPWSQTCNAGPKRRRKILAGYWYASLSWQISPPGVLVRERMPFDRRCCALNSCLRRGSRALRSSDNRLCSSSPPRLDRLTLLNG